MGNILGRAVIHETPDIAQGAVFNSTVTDTLSSGGEQKKIDAVPTLHAEAEKQEDIEQKLHQIDEEFSDFDKSVYEMSDEDIEYRTKELVGKLITAINQAQDEKYLIEKIRSALPNAYRVHGYSSLVDHLRRYKNRQGHYTSIDILVDKIETGISNSEPHHKKIGKIIGGMALESPLAQQHREKLKIQADAVKEVCEKVKSPHIIMVASGSARDLENIQQELIQSKANVTLIDMYNDALDVAVANLATFSKCVEDPDENPMTYPVDVESLFRTKSESSKRFRSHVFKQPADILVAGGLFDYFRDVSIRRFLETISHNESRIKEDGVVLFTNIADVDNPYLVWADVMGHWSLKSRSEENMKDLQAVLGFSKNSLELDPTGLTWIAKSINSNGK